MSVAAEPPGGWKKEKKNKTKSTSKKVVGWAKKSLLASKSVRRTRLTEAKCYSPTRQ